MVSTADLGAEAWNMSGCCCTSEASQREDQSPCVCMDSVSLTLSAEVVEQRLHTRQKLVAWSSVLCSRRRLNCKPPRRLQSHKRQAQFEVLQSMW